MGEIEILERMDYLQRESRICHQLIAQLRAGEVSWENAIQKRQRQIMTLEEELIDLSLELQERSSWHFGMSGIEEPEGHCLTTVKPHPNWVFVF